MLTESEERRIRETVRQGLDNILNATMEPSSDGASSPDDTTRDLERLAEAERIIAEETQRYYDGRGLVKHETSDGRLLWVTPTEAARFRGHNSRRRRRRGRTRINPKIALVWGVTITLAVLLVAYLVQTETLGAISGGM